MNTITAVFVAQAENAKREARRRCQPTQEQLDLAFGELLQEIAGGREYPDAIWIITQRHRVSSVAMQEMYDAHHNAI